MRQAACLALCRSSQFLRALIRASEGTPICCKAHQARLVPDDLIDERLSRLPVNCSNHSGSAGLRGAGGGGCFVGLAPMVGAMGVAVGEW